jgi:hypothetical protein
MERFLEAVTPLGAVTPRLTIRGREFLSYFPACSVSPVNYVNGLLPHRHRSFQLERQTCFCLEWPKGSRATTVAASNSRSEATIIHVILIAKESSPVIAFRHRAISATQGPLSGKSHGYRLGNKRFGRSHHD